jgi:hypothetical protein
MNSNIFSPLGCCDERLVTDFVDKRMTKKEATLYLRKIENCAKVKNCQKCKKLLDDFTILKEGCTSMKQPLVMPDTLEHKLLNRLHEALIQTKSK